MNEQENVKISYFTVYVWFYFTVYSNCERENTFAVVRTVRRNDCAKLYIKILRCYLGEHFSPGECLWWRARESEREGAMNHSKWYSLEALRKAIMYLSYQNAWPNRFGVEFTLKCRSLDRAWQSEKYAVFHEMGSVRNMLSDKMSEYN